MKLSADNVAKLPLPEPGKNQALYFDDALKGFGVRVTSTGARAFVFDTKIGSKSRRVTIGRCNELSIVAARAKAKSLAGQIAMGGDPVAENKIARLKAKTLAEVVEDYFSARELKATTVKDQRCAMRQMGGLLSKPVNEISEDDIKAHHAKRGQRSKARANLEVRYLHAWIQFARTAYKIDGAKVIEANPAGVIAEERRVFRVNRKRTRLQDHQFGAWVQAVNGLDSAWREFFLLLAATGLRRTEALSLKWADIDLAGGLLVVRDPKNHQAHELPIPSRTHAMLKGMKAKHDARPQQNQTGWVFSDAKGVQLRDPRTAMLRVSAAAGGVSCNPHDLRRTFASVADELDLGRYTVKRLLNHSDQGDVTSGYISVSMDKLRRAIQEIEDTIFADAT